MNPASLISLLIALLPQLKAYFSKNKGLNTVSGGLLGTLLTIVAVGLQQTATVDQLITWLQNYGPKGLIAAAVVAGLRTAVEVYKASKKA